MNEIIYVLGGFLLGVIATFGFWLMKKHPLWLLMGHPVRDDVLADHVKRNHVRNEKAELITGVVELCAVVSSDMSDKERRFLSELIIKEVDRTRSK